MSIPFAPKATNCLSLAIQTVHLSFQQLPLTLDSSGLFLEIYKCYSIVI